MPGPSTGAAAETAGRLFLGVAIPEPTRHALVRHLNASLGDRSLPGRAVPPRNWHFTLRFLGDASTAQALALQQQLHSAEFGEAFRMRFGELGAFPRPARASVLWLGVEDGADSLARLAAVAESAARGAGFPSETRPFRAHLTLSRMQPPQDVHPVLRSIPQAATWMEVEHLVLFRSHLGSGPPRYQALHRFALNRPGN